MESTNGIWPFSYDKCGMSGDAVEADKAQKISNCNTNQGRGSPEIDIIEAMPGDYVLPYKSVRFHGTAPKDCDLGRPMMSMSLHVAPGVSRNQRPSNSVNFPGDGQWYQDLYPMGGTPYPKHDEIDECDRLLNTVFYGSLINEVPRVW